MQNLKSKVKLAEMDSRVVVAGAEGSGDRERLVKRYKLSCKRNKL